MTKNTTSKLHEKRKKMMSQNPKEKANPQRTSKPKEG